MLISSLKLQNWRSHKNLDFKFNDITVLSGPNAIGKTNLLEAVYYISTGRSFRAKDGNLIGWGESFSRIEAELGIGQTREVAVILENVDKRIRKTIKVNDQKIASSKLLGELNSVIFTPEEIELIASLPEARRRYLNLTISQTDRKYAYNLLHYKKVLEQRNSLLKRIRDGLAKEEELEVWDGKFAEYAEYLVLARAEYIKKINKTLGAHYHELSGEIAGLKLVYYPSIDPSGGWSGIVLSLAESRQDDVFSKVTTKGPHRDDFAFQIDGKNVLTFASRGELRTVILALKLAELDFMEARIGHRPLLLLDDVYSELDENRRNLLSQILAKQQTIITTTDLDHISKNVLAEAKIVELK